MLNKRILGTETEYGIVAKDPELMDHVSNSILLVNSFPDPISSKIIWDYENENPFRDARGFEIEGEKERPGPDYNRMLNKVLLNGGRLYVDGAHPEFSTPECTNARDIVLYEKAGDRLVDICRKIASQLRKDEDKFIIYKNNTDGKGNSYGYHENYLMKRKIDFGKITEQIVPFLVTRQIYAGSGKVSGIKTEEIPYQISQRADFFEVLVDLNTMAKRPVMNTRDEPHADPEKFRRLHVIVGDANMSEYTTFLKIGATSILIALIDEEQVDMKDLALQDPVSSIKEISRDLTLKKKIRLNDGRRFTAVEIQREYLERINKKINGIESDPIIIDIIKKWGYVLDKLEEDPLMLSREIDWIIKFELLKSYTEKRGCNWKDAKISMMDLQYHDIRMDKGLYYRLEKGGYVEKLLSSDEIEKAKNIPPTDTRAYFRSTCLKKFPKEVCAASWTSVLFDIGNSTLKRIPLMEPLRGTKELTDELINNSNSVKELLSKITA